MIVTVLVLSCTDSTAVISSSYLLDRARRLLTQFRYAASTIEHCMSIFKQRIGSATLVYLTIEEPYDKNEDRCPRAVRRPRCRTRGSWCLLAPACKGHRS